MSIKTYIVGKDNKIKNISHAYGAGGTYKVMSSGNVKSFNFTNGVEGAQALAYTSISFGNGISQIPDRCCYKFMNLKTVTINTSRVTAIGKEAFSQCTSLQSINFPEQMSLINEDAFYNCTSLAKVQFPSKTPVKLGNQAFCKSGIQVLQVKTSDNIEKRAFAECTSLASATVEGGIGEQMFAGCTALKSVAIKGNASSIPAGMFNGCSALKTLTLSNIKKITSIGANAFYGCASLTSFDLGSTRIASIGASAFARSGITSLEVPATITSSTQLDPQFLAGSNVTSLKFLGIDSTYMNSHINDFLPFISIQSNLKIYSSDGQSFQSSGSHGSSVSPIISSTSTIYIITIGLCGSVPKANYLTKIDTDCTTFLDMVNSSYSDNPNLILGVSELRDKNTKYITGNKDNLNAAFDAAVESQADMLLFHFSDHGGYRQIIGDGYLCLVGTGDEPYRYTYEELFNQFKRFKNVFAIFCCCKPVSSKIPFDQISQTTKALFWAACVPEKDSYHTGGNGHELMVYLKNHFNKNYTWEQEWDNIHVRIPTHNLTPVQYNYNNFPNETNKIFKIEK